MHLYPQNDLDLIILVHNINVLEHDVPAFKKIDCQRKYRHFDLCLEVDYEPNKENDMMFLRKVKNEETVFKGRLKKEQTRVAVTIEDPSNPDEIEVVGNYP